ncbi:MAG: hypothetical protein HKO89_08045, partial [Saprospiraceae bacterium]|nr:hypothetical protein [Saprospiraceae bacterium]
MRSLLTLLVVVSFCAFSMCPAHAEGGFMGKNDMDITEHFDPYNVSFVDHLSESVPGTTIVNSYAGSGHFFSSGSIWNSAGQIAMDPDSIGASVFLFPGDTSRYLYARDFGFDIPCNATITNITFRVARQNNSLVDVADAMVALFNPQTFSPGSLNMKNPAIWIEGGTDWETITYSHANWGESITPELINNERFGLLIQVEQLLTAGLALPVVDAVELEVCYTVGSPFTSPISFATEKVDACFNEGSITITASGGSGSYEYSIDGGSTWTSNPVFDNLALGDYILTVRNTDGTCQTEIFYCNLSGDDRILHAGDAIVACATFPGNDITLAIEKLQPMNELYIAGERGYDISFLLPFHPYEWSINDLQGEVYSFSIDKTRNIYTATTMLYDLNPGGDVPPIVSRIDAFTGEVQILDTLPGDAGATGVEYDTICEQLFVANLSDGIIYRIDPDSGLTLSTFDPGVADNGAIDMAPLGERILGMGYNHIDNKLYYAVWASDFDRNGIRNTIRSISIDPVSCDFLPATDQLEVTLPWTSEYGDPLNPLDYSMPVGDIEFSTDGNTMLVGETGFDSNVPASKPHESRVLRYLGSSASWTLQTTVPSGNFELQHELGEVSAGFNARGGVDFANSGFDGSECSIDNDEYIIATADALRGADCNSIGCLYGLQYLPITGGNSAGSVLLDIARDINSQQKSVFGDVDWIQGCPDPVFCCPEVMLTTSDQEICRNESLNTLNLTTTADSIVFAYFTSVPTDSIQVYNGGTPIDTVGVSSGMASSNLSAFPSGTAGTYYIYARVHPTPDNISCRPYDSIIVTIHADPTPSINDPADQCVNGADMNFTGSPLQSGGTIGSFSTTASGGLSDNTDGTAILDVSAAGAGTWDVIYSYTDLNGCSAFATSSITIFDLPAVISISDPA